MSIYHEHILKEEKNACMDSYYHIEIHSPSSYSNKAPFSLSPPCCFSVYMLVQLQAEKKAKKKKWGNTLLPEDSC